MGLHIDQVARGPVVGATEPLALAGSTNLGEQNKARQAKRQGTHHRAPDLTGSWPGPNQNVRASPRARCAARRT